VTSRTSETVTKLSCIYLFIYLFIYLCVYVCVCVVWILSSVLLEDASVYFERRFWSSALRRRQVVEVCAIWTKLIVSVSCPLDLWSRQSTPQSVRTHTLLLQIRFNFTSKREKIFVRPSATVQSCMYVPKLLATEFFQQREVWVRW
jgi:hypothetical protein